ncbi:MAG: nucleotide sugar dehydrogenase [Oligoflexia bacterium]|nr:nucleotide sugar dehydrogenase [Oligoflexia bacterium]
MVIGFAGLSHLGINSGIAIASKGFDVIAYDQDAPLVDALNKKQLPIFEPGLEELLTKSADRITFTSKLEDLKKADVIYISLDVSTDEKNTSDLTNLKKIISNVIEKADLNNRPQASLVVLSQVPPGFTRKLATSKFNLLYQVETLIFGRAVERALFPERYIVGCADPKKDLPPVYKKLLENFNCPILPMRYESAELAKISINMYLAASVTVTNTLAEICEKIGANWYEISPSLKLDRRIGPHAYLAPGLGLSGGNIERDIATIQNLSQEHGTQAHVADAFTSNSQYRKEWVLRTAHVETLSKHKDAMVAVWGLAYKQETKSIKNSPAVALLEGMKGVNVQIYDPQAVLPQHLEGRTIKQTSNAIEACRNAHALLIMTPWSEFTKADLKQAKAVMKGKTVIDPHGMLDPKNCEELGFEYFKLGVNL